MRRIELNSPSVQSQETIAFGPGIFTPGGIRDEDSEGKNRRSCSPQISVKSLQREGAVQGHQNAIH